MAVVSRKLILPLMVLLGGVTDALAEEGDDALPPPPDAQAINAQAVFHLSLVVNYYDTELVVPVTRRQGNYIVASRDLQRAGIPAEHLPPGDVDLSTLADVRTEYDSNRQRLLLFVPRE